jgi:phosphatidylglycerophosphate synthase
LALRLALDAQRAGASAVVIEPSSALPVSMLADARLKIPVLEAPPPDARIVRASASLLVHRDIFKTLDDAADEVTLSPETPPVPGSAVAFSPIDVVDKVAAGRAERLLFRSLRKPEDGWTSRYLNRYISLSISRFLVRTSLRPNQVSVAILAVGILGAWLASRGTYASLVAGAFLFQAQSVLDGCDGEMSRVTYRGSHLGEWLDTIGDDLTNYGFFAGAAVGLHTRTGGSLYLVAGGVILFCGLTASFFEYRYLLKIGSGDLLKYPTSRTASDGKGLLAAIAPLFKRDTFVFLVLVAAIADLTGPMLIVFALAAIGILANVLAAEVSMRRAERRPNEPRPE